MIKKLKTKFLLITFITIFVVVGIIIGYINLHNYTTTINKHNNVIDVVLTSDDSVEHSTEFEKIIFRNIIIIKVENDIPTLIKGNLNDDITLNELYNNTINKKEGSFDHYLFKVSEEGDSTLIVISNYEIDKQLISNFFINSLIISLSGILVLYIAIYLSSSYILKPFIINEKNQKEFITNASHELRTPITIIKANLDVLKIDNITNEWTESIETQATRLEVLTSNLINLSKVEENNSSIIKTDFSLSDALLEESTNYKSLLNEKNIELIFKNNSNISFFGDEKQIRDVIKLLLDNIVKYSTEGFVEIKVENKELYFINSTDLSNGSYDYIFNRFTRLDEARNQTVSGFGIGLSIVKKILDNHQCNVSAQVENNKFIIKIKL